jgi:cell filamentation protein
MTLENKLGITDAVELARVEEKMSKAQAHKLFTGGFLDTLPCTKPKTLRTIKHDIYNRNRL